MMRVGSMVHYVSRGSADGVFSSVCRAAIVTATSFGDDEIVALGVINPNGVFHDNAVEFHADGAPGTWHSMDECPEEDDLDA